MQKYLVERLSARQIAFLIGCSHIAVNRALKKFGLIREPTPSGRLGFEIGIGSKGRFFEKRRKKLIQRMLKMREQGVSFRKIAKWLESKDIPAPSGKMKWYAGTIKAILKRASPTNDTLA